MSKTQSYQVAEKRVEDLFAPGSVAFEIPVYQRRYAWGTDEVAALMADLYADDTAWLHRAEDAEPYFLGSLVLQKPEHETDAELVLDGQQRLTTISLLLATLLYKLKAHGNKRAHMLERYLEAGRLRDPQRKKIRLQEEDRKVYERLIDDPSAHESRELKHTALARAVRTIFTNLDIFLKQAAEAGVPENEALEKMAERVLYNVEFVRITAVSASAAFRLFETLNDRGLPLNAADLVKNKLFAQCAPRHLDDARQIWREISEWVDDTEIIHFLRYFWIASQQSVRKDRLYDVVGKHLSTLEGVRALGFAQKLRDAAKLYRSIASPKDSPNPWSAEVREGLMRLVSFRARSCRPALLACGLIHPTAMPGIVKACEAVTVRYSLIAEKNPNALERAYDKFCRELSPDVEPLEIFESCLGALVPPDEAVVKLFPDVEVSSTTTVWREVLVRLNEMVATGETRVEGADKVHVEHVLPRSPSLQALEESGLSAERAEELAANIGNLTLLSGRRNQAISNRSFSAKKPVYEASDIALTRKLGQYERWGEAEIRARAKDLAKLAVQAWPWPPRA